MNLVFVAAIIMLQASFKSLALRNEALYLSLYPAGPTFHDFHLEL